MDSAFLPTFDLSLGAAGLRFPAGADIRWLFGFARSSGYQAVQLNAADPLTRPRNLSRSGRRDLASHLRRDELVSSGIDLWIPKAHFTDPMHCDRAVSAMLDAIRFAADMAELTGGERLLSTLLPQSTPRGAIDDIAESALEVGVEIANHAYPWDDQFGSDSPIRIGLDPSAVILAGENAPGAVSRASHSGRLSSVRLSDLSEAGRVQPGEGSLDLLAYRVAVATSQFTRHLIVDLRGLPSGADQGGQLEVAQDIASDFGRSSAPGSA